MSFLALALIGAGSSYGRAREKQLAIDVCAKQIVKDWSGLYDVKGKPCDINVFDIGDIKEVRWDARGVFHYVDGEQIYLDRLELANVILPKR